LLRILVMWEAILEVLEIVKKDSIKPTCNGGAFGLIGKMETFDFCVHPAFDDRVIEHYR